MIGSDKSLSDLAAEYLQNAKIMEHRISQLELQVKTEKQLEARRKLRKRIYTLISMVNDCRASAYQLQHYYDTPEERKYERKKRATPIRKERAKFSRHGYGNPAPAAAMGSGAADAKPVSSFHSAFLGRD